MVTAALAARPALAAGGNADKLAIRVVAPQKGGAGLTVTSSAFKEGAAIPERYAGYRIGPSPPLAWTKGPQGTRSYALLVEDPDAPGAEPFVHWVAYDIPADATSLPEGVPSSPQPVAIVQMRQGRNSFGSVGWRGPEPPTGQTHHYHFEVFALDDRPPLDPEADRDALVGAMRGHVLAAGELAGTFARK